MSAVEAFMLLGLLLKSTTRALLATDGPLIYIRGNCDEAKGCSVTLDKGARQLLTKA